MKKNYFVYILKCSDDSYYVGVTNDPDRRVNEHNNTDEERSYTSSRRPVELIWKEEHRYINNAINREKQIKRWSRVKKEALMKGDLHLLKPLAKKKIFFRIKPFSKE